MLGLKGSGDVVDFLPAREVIFHYRSMVNMAYERQNVDRRCLGGRGFLLLIDPLDFRSVACAAFLLVLVVDHLLQCHRYEVRRTPIGP